MNFFPSRFWVKAWCFVRSLLCQVSTVSRVCLGTLRSQIVHNTFWLSFVTQKVQLHELLCTKLLDSIWNAWKVSPNFIIKSFPLQAIILWQCAAQPQSNSFSILSRDSVVNLKSSKSFASSESVYRSSCISNHFHIWRGFLKLKSFISTAMSGEEK